MKIKTILLLGVLSAAAQGAFAQNGCGSGPPVAPAAPAASSIVPVIQQPLLLPIRIAGSSVQFNETAIIDGGQRRAARKSAARARLS
jgi:hypothetical protein